MYSLTILQKASRIWKTCCGVVLIFLMLTTYASGEEVLFVVGKKYLKGTDQSIMNVLKNRGHAVTIVKDNTVRSEDAYNKDLIIISDSVLTLNVNSKFRSSNVPVICLDPWLLDDLGMTAKARFKDFGRQRRQQNIVITNPEHPLAAFYSGSVQVCCTKSLFMGWGVPGEAAIKVAALEKDHNKSTIFAYEAGAEMPDGVAPARRAGFFLLKEHAETVSSDGWLLFNATVDWAISTPQVAASAKTESDKS